MGLESKLNPLSYSVFVFLLTSLAPSSPLSLSPLTSSIISSKADMSEGAEYPVINLGGKGSSLSAASVHAIANRLASVRIDSSALERLSSCTNASLKYQIILPHFLTSEEARASLVVLLNKLLLAGSACIRTAIPLFLAETLNSNKNVLELEPLDVTEDEISLLKQSHSILDGISALLDHKSAALSTIIDAVASMSCEVLKADLKVFNLMDSGDGFVAKDEVGVANDMKVLLNGSKLLGNADNDGVSKIPKIHGSLREQVKTVHSKTRVELNSVSRAGKGGCGSSGTDNVMRTVLLPLAFALWDVGKCSADRGRMNLDKVNNDNLRSGLIGMYERECPSDDSLLRGFKLVTELVFDEKYYEFVHNVNGLLDSVWRIMVWEAITSFIALEGSALIISSQHVENGGDEKAAKKGDKKKKVVLGKGTSLIIQLIAVRLQRKGGDSTEVLSLLEKWIKDLLSFLDPNGLEIDSFVKKVKEIVESNESRRLPKLPKGTRDFAKEQMTIRKQAFSIIEDVFERHGATALDTPVFELRETLMGKYGEDSKLIYDLADQGGELCSLRYDLTVPFARFVAMNGITSLKRYQIAKVYRRDNPSKGRFREFYQCDFDIAGQYEKMGPDFEVIKILTELLDELSIGAYEIKLNHRKLLDGMLEICGVPPEKFRTICSSVDKLDKQSFEQIRKELVEEKGLTEDVADKIGTFVKEKGQPLELLSKLQLAGSEFMENKGSVDALSELQILFNALEKAKCIENVVFDLSLARGLDYYTGVIFEAVFKGGAQVGSIAAGGRYDNLIGMFGSKQIPAVGVSLGIERVFVIMEQLLKDQNQTTRATKTEVLVSLLGEDLSQAAELVSELWGAKVKAEYLVNKRVMKHIDRAKESRIPWIVFIGERELNDRVVKLKNVESYEEVTIRRTDIVEELKKQLSQ